LLSISSLRVGLEDVVANVVDAAEWMHILTGRFRQVLSLAERSAILCISLLEISILPLVLLTLHPYVYGPPARLAYY
jgi:hypothetical protein